MTKSRRGVKLHNSPTRLAFYWSFFLNWTRERGVVIGILIFKIATPRLLGVLNASARCSDSKTLKHLLQKQTVGPSRLS